MRNYHSDDIPFDVRKVTYAMFTFREYEILDGDWNSPVKEQDYSAFNDILVQPDFLVSDAVSAIRMLAT
ncbi:MAG: hypothetical protein ACFFER_15785 [Candidatus Thorarchaeota archaeon]